MLSQENKKFRGKRKDNGDWVKGFLVRSDQRTFIAAYPECITSLYYPDYIYSFTSFLEVDPETVGTFIGLTDKNNIEIFDGDIVREYSEDKNCEYDYSIYDEGRVFYYNELTRYLRTSKNFPDNCPEMSAWREYEVIGNIFEDVI